MPTISQIQRKTVFALTVALLALLWPAALALAQSGVWQTIASPNQGTNDNQLLGAAPVSAGDVWSVGYYNAGPYTNSLRTLAEHWNGASWTIVATPNPATGSGDYDSLRGVTALSTSNAWTVGYSGNSNLAADKSLIEHWNGTSWSIVSSPSPYTTQRLHGVAAVSSRDVWAVGEYTNYKPYGYYGALIERWNGTKWRAVSNPATGGLYGVAAVAGNDVWAVGGAQVLHWNGTDWAIVPSPQPQNGTYYYLRAVAAVSASDIWAVGYATIPSGDGYVYGALIEHWDGSSWRLISGAGYDTALYGVAALSATSVWAVGGSAGQTLVEKWDGNQWAQVPSANVVGASANTLQAAAAVPTAGDVWAVGEYQDATAPYQSHTLIEECMAC